MKKFSRVIQPTVSVTMAALFLARLLLSYPVSAGEQFVLPGPEDMAHLGPRYRPAIIRGMRVDLRHPFRLEFIIDRGEEKLGGEDLERAGQRLARYFFTALTVPEDQLWVNLSPYEKNRITPESLGGTEMGRDMLAQDYQLKQLASSLLHPESDLGRAFWSRVYARSREIFGTADIPVNAFNKVWIVPENAVVYEQWPSAYVARSHLRVMLEEDYLAWRHNTEQTGSFVGSGPGEEVQQLRQVASGIMREVIIPALEEEINHGKSFAQVRQIYNSVILAMWYKRRLKETLLGQAYADQNKIRGVDVEDKNVKEKIYEAYLTAVSGGVFNYIKEEYDEASQDIIARRYFSGGMSGPEDVRIEDDSRLLAPGHQVPTESEAGNLIRMSVEGRIILPQGVAGSTSGERFMAKSSPAHFLMDVIENPELLRAFLTAEGMTAREMIPYRKRRDGTSFSRPTLFREFQALRALGLITLVEGTRGRYRFSDEVIALAGNFDERGLLTLRSFISFMSEKILMAGTAGAEGMAAPGSRSYGKKMQAAQNNVKKVFLVAKILRAALDSLAREDPVIFDEVFEARILRNPSHPRLAQGQRLFFRIYQMYGWNDFSRDVDVLVPRAMGLLRGLFPEGKNAVFRYPSEPEGRKPSWGLSNGNGNERQARTGLEAEMRIALGERTPDGLRLLNLGINDDQVAIDLIRQGFQTLHTGVELEHVQIFESKIRQDMSAEEFQRTFVKAGDHLQVLRELKSESMDMVHAYMTLQFYDVKSLEAIMVEIERVLKPGGKLVFMVTSDQDWHLSRRIRSKKNLDDFLFFPGRGRRPIRFFTRGFVLSLLEGARLKEVSLKTVKIAGWSNRPWAGVAIKPETPGPGRADKAASLARADNPSAVPRGEEAGAGKGENFGGIDFNADALDLMIQRDENGFPLPLGQQPLEHLSIEGILPVILEISPVTVPMLPLLRVRRWYHGGTSRSN